ncbi:hypothetical protein EMCRGX_G006093 [Ephydatia muelleri]
MRVPRPDILDKNRNTSLLPIFLCENERKWTNMFIFSISWWYSSKLEELVAAVCDKEQASFKSSSWHVSSNSLNIFVNTPRVIWRPGKHTYGGEDYPKSWSPMCASQMVHPVYKVLPPVLDSDLMLHEA